MILNYIKYFDLNLEPAFRVEWFSSFIDAYERRNALLDLISKRAQNCDIYFDGEVRMIEYFNRKELVDALNRINEIP